MQIGKISKFFSFDPLPFSQRGLEGKKPTFRVSRGPEEEERKEKNYLYYTESLVAIY
jgi:hypothetical protein